MTQPTSPPHPAYLRNPHPHGDLVAFTAEDDVWVAPLDGGRAWRLSADNMPVGRPRISPDGEHVAWTSTRDGAPEVHTAPLDGGPSRRLTYWGNGRTAVRCWTPGRRSLVAVTSHGEASARRTWARAAAAGRRTRRAGCRYGPVGDLAYGPGGAVLLQSVTMGREAAYWKRYRGGTAGKLWLDPDGGGEFARVHAELDGNIECPMWVGDRIAFLSDHEGVGALYSSLPDGSDLRRHSPARRVLRPARRHRRHPGGVRRRAARMHLLDGLDAEPRPLDVRLGGQRTDLQPHPVRAAALPGRRPARPHRPRQRRRGARHHPLGHPPRRPGPGAGRRAGRTHPAAAGVRAGRRPVRGVGHRRRRRRRAGDRPGHRAAGRRRAAPARRRTAGPGARDGGLARRPPDRRRLARRAGAAGRQAQTGEVREVLAGEARRRHRPGLLARLRLAGLVPPRARLAAADQARLDRRPLASPTRPRCASTTSRPPSPPTAGTWRSCPSGPSTRSTTPTSSTCRSPTPAART